MTAPWQNPAAPWNQQSQPNLIARHPLAAAAATTVIYSMLGPINRSRYWRNWGWLLLLFFTACAFAYPVFVVGTLGGLWVIVHTTRKIYKLRAQTADAQLTGVAAHLRDDLLHGCNTANQSVEQLEALHNHLHQSRACSHSHGGFSQ